MTRRQQVILVEWLAYIFMITGFIGAIQTWAGLVLVVLGGAFYLANTRALATMSDKEDELP